ncbi:DUF262 domain-containing protein [Nonomuraea aridisoli]|uniref:GmrSD restriction endonucleases N-terminal domain-containing protein n=1 Tax=Nonomuraea aridisoli TaxID=2070368 RepID=A0A2W2EVY6_9ACTN|nr:DUF262 domain-containing protein [Nonomuraea aridisoli]PZG16628.1 hypothetical protein C1J01_20375 [Nonomuraea aridisoli]
MSRENERDIEETAEELDSDSRSAEEKQVVRRRWEQARREIFTNVIDYTVDSIVRLVDERNLDLNTPYQRRDRWDIGRKSRLVESLLLSIPIPPVYLNEEGDYTFQIIDGKQRLAAIYEFAKGEYALRNLSVFYEAEGLTFGQLDPILQRSLISRAGVRAVIILNASDPTIQYELFHRLNAGGVALNAQELRHGIYRGPLDDLIMELSEHPKFREALGIGAKSHSSAMWREMRDAELVLRFFVLREHGMYPLASASNSLTEYMRDNSYLSAVELTNMRQEFLDALDKAILAFGPLLFRRWNTVAERESTQISLAVYEAQMLAVKDFDYEDIAGHAQAIQEGLRDMFRNFDFASSMSPATMNSPAALKHRVARIRDVIRRALGQ